MGNCLGYHTFAGPSCTCGDEEFIEEGEGTQAPSPSASVPHRARRDVIGWGSVTHPPECTDPRCPVVQAVMAGKVDREGGVTGPFDLHLQDDGWVLARHWALVR